MQAQKGGELRNNNNRISTLNPKNLLRRVFPTARRLLVETDIRRYCIDKYRRVLVVGAGHDPYRSRFLSANLYTALDIVAIPEATDVVGDALQLPFGDGTFDCVVAIEVMEHVKDPNKLVAEAHRVLAKDGTMLLSVPFAFHQHANPADYWRPTIYALKMLTSIFEKSIVLPQGNRIHVISDLITTSFHNYPVFLPLRIINYLFVLSVAKRLWKNYSSAPSGFFVVANK